MIVPGSTSQTLAAALAEETGLDLAAVEFDTFPDGERYCRVHGTESADRAVIVASSVSAESHVELLQLQDAMQEAGIDDVTTVIPYLGYARQDEAFEAGEPVSARAMARALSTATDRVLTVNPHEEAVCDFFSVPTKAIDAADVLAEPLPNLRDPLFLSPDEGAIHLATSVRDAYDRGETDYFEKTRTDGDTVEIHPSDAAVDDRDVVLVDDIIATGSTMSESISIVDDRGAHRVFVTCVHPLLARNAYTKLKRAGVETIAGTDTIERPASVVSVAPKIAAALD
jgi:ribose-phosphate pyrophosphokinase